MQALTLLIVTCVLFVATHMLVPHSLRSAIVLRTGEKGFQLVYSMVAIATFILMIQAFRHMPSQAPLWEVGNALWTIASLMILLASVLFIGSLVGNPAVPRPQEQSAKITQAEPQNVFAITRHPMMWGIALWALAHAMVVPTAAQWVLSSALIILALGGALSQDRKKTLLMRQHWPRWVEQTSFFPFGRQIARQKRWTEISPGAHALLGGITIWLLASWAHGALGYMAAGLWRWTGG